LEGSKALFPGILLRDRRKHVLGQRRSEIVACAIKRKLEIVGIRIIIVVIVVV
jgi:hypothetical protein